MSAPRRRASAHAAGRSNSRSSTACTSVPRAVAGGRRLGDAVDHPEPVQQRAGHEVSRARRRQRRRRVARRAEASRRSPGRQPTCSMSTSATTLGFRGPQLPPIRAGQPTAEQLRSAPTPHPGRAPPDPRACRRMHVASVMWQVARRSSRTGAVQTWQTRSPQRLRRGAAVRHPRLRLAVLVHHRRRLHRHLRQRPVATPCSGNDQVRGRRRLRGPALPLRAGARAGPLGRGPRLRPAGAPHPALPARRHLRDRPGGRRPPAASSPSPPPGPALSLVLGAFGWGLAQVVTARRDAAR